MKTKIVFNSFIWFLVATILFSGTISTYLNVLATKKTDVECLVEEALSTEELVYQALALSDFWDDKYIDFDYLNRINNQVTLNVYNDIYDDSDQFLAKSVMKIFDDLSSDDIDFIQELSKTDEDVQSLLTLVENGFNVNELSNINNTIELSMSISVGLNQLLSSAQLTTAAITTINGAFSAMLAAFKLVLTPNVIKIAVAVAAILVITAVVVYNWNKIQPVFQDIINLFVSAAESFGNSIANVFDQVFASANENYDKNIITYAFATTITMPSTTRNVYYIAYLAAGRLNINKQYVLNYLEAYSVLLASGMLKSTIELAKFAIIPLNSALTNFANNLSKLNIGEQYVGVYAYQRLDAAKLAYALGGFYEGYLLDEIHDERPNSGFYYHFHDKAHRIHVWYGSAA